MSVNIEVKNNRILVEGDGADGKKFYDFGPDNQEIADQNGNNPIPVNQLPVEALDVTENTGQFFYWQSAVNV